MNTPFPPDLTLVCKKRHVDISPSTVLPPAWDNMMLGIIVLGFITRPPA